MRPEQAERLVVLTMRLLALTFAVVGLLFIVTPNGVIGRMDDVGNWIGSFPSGPRSDEKLWLSLGFAYMVVITGIALVISSRRGSLPPVPARARGGQGGLLARHAGPTSSSTRTCSSTS